MSREWRDISVPVAPHLTPGWPGTPALRFEAFKAIERGDTVRDTTLCCSVHTGTHIDAPAHFLEHGGTVDAIPLEPLMGPCQVVDVQGNARITEAVLEQAGVAEGATRLLLHTDNSRQWRPVFHEAFVGLTVGAARWLAARPLKLLGIDYLSVQPYSGDDDVHRLLLSAQVVLLEGLDLSDVAPGGYELCCLPIKLVGVEAAPARAVLRPLPEEAR